MIELFHNATISNEQFHDLDDERFAHLKKVCEDKNFIDGEILEFGVYSGKTINFISNYWPDQTVYGFDSFEGLPEDWDTSYKEKFNKHKKGYFAVEKLPEVNNNVNLVKGFFDTSLPNWLQNNNIEVIKLLHIDSDLYSSAKTIFDNLNDYIVPGTVIVFDELYSWGRKRYETWEQHEYRALCEWVETYNRKFEVMYRNNHMQCSIRITQ